MCWGRWRPWGWGPPSASCSSEGLRQRHAGVSHAGHHAEVHALDALARGIAVELPVARLEGVSERVGIAPPGDFELVVLPRVAEVRAPYEGDLPGRDAFVEQRPEAALFELLEPILGGLRVPHVEARPPRLDGVVPER